MPTYSRTSIHIEVPPGVTMVPERSFEDYKQLKTIIFPNTLKHIGNSAFKGCHRLQFVYLPEGLLTTHRQQPTGVVRVIMMSDTTGLIEDCMRGKFVKIGNG